MKIGIVGSGLRTIMILDTIKDIEGVDCTAIWYREQDIEGALELKHKYNICNTYEDINQFLNDESFDVVYIALINHLHYEYVKLALSNNRHVICEKPFTSTLSESNELVQIAKEKHLFLFESVMLRYSDNYELIRENITQLGDMKMIQFNFSQYSRRYDKYKDGIVLPSFDPKYSGGSLYDLTVYCVHFIVGIFGSPKNVAYYANKGFNGIDTSGSLILDYDSFKAICNVAKDSASPSFCILQGDKGFIEVKSKPGNVQNVNLTLLKNNVTELLDAATASDNPLLDVFLKIRSIINENDYDKCYSMIESSKKVMDILEQARKFAQIEFGADAKLKGDLG